MPAVSNSSPLIGFSAIGRLELLHFAYGEIIVPPAVWRETVSRGAGRAGAIEVAEAPWIQLQTPSEQALALVSGAGLDRGEAEAIALARSLQPRIPVLLDDLRARRVAEEAGLAVTGTAGVLILAKQLGLISTVGLLLTELQMVGHYLSESVTAMALERANER